MSLCPHQVMRNTYPRKGWTREDDIHLEPVALARTTTSPEYDGSRSASPVKPLWAKARGVARMRMPLPLGGSSQPSARTFDRTHAQVRACCVWPLWTSLVPACSQPMCLSVWVTCTGAWGSGTGAFQQL